MMKWINLTKSWNMMTTCRPPPAFSLVLFQPSALWLQWCWEALRVVTPSAKNPEQQAEQSHGNAWPREESHGALGRSQVFENCWFRIPRMGRRACRVHLVRGCFSGLIYGLYRNVTSDSFIFHMFFIWTNWKFLKNHRSNSLKEKIKCLASKNWKPSVLLGPISPHPTRITTFNNLVCILPDLSVQVQTQTYLKLDVISYDTYLIKKWDPMIISFFQLGIPSRIFISRH